ncbi:MAG: ABC transporter ATP-binding protein [Firmicutes bacterium]|nr:ABC transporter ATP-binding protein [Bacillota bacterium]
MSIITFANIKKTYEEVKVLEDFNLVIDEGEFVVLLGPSGCGKTTILKLINGLLKPDEGELTVKGVSVEKWNPIELRRNMGYVIQQVGLFPHLTIEGNICYTLNLTKVNKDNQHSRAKELIALVGLDDSYLSRYPRELSGGQQQRVGVARALAANPDIILMDEPFGAVDEVTRRTLQEEISNIHKKLGKTIIFVTHDIEEAIKLGSRIVLLNKGRIDRDKQKKDFVLSKEKTDYAENFFGSKDFMAYLNSVKVNSCLEYDTESKASSAYPTISEESSVLQGIQKCIETESNILSVVDNGGVYMGYFIIDSIYKHLLAL